MTPQMQQSMRTTPGSADSWRKFSTRGGLPKERARIGEESLGTSCLRPELSWMDAKLESAGNKVKGGFVAARMLGCRLHE